MGVGLQLSPVSLLYARKRMKKKASYEKRPLQVSFMVLNRCLHLYFWCRRLVH
jgi:hypothetical protein